MPPAEPDQPGEQQEGGEDVRRLERADVEAVGAERLDDEARDRVAEQVEPEGVAVAQAAVASDPQRDPVEDHAGEEVVERLVEEGRVEVRELLLADRAA